MANHISHISKNVSHSISNGWTTVLYSVLLISGSKLAETHWEKLFLIWLAEHDQNHLGQGMVGIDVDSIHWSNSEYEQQGEFIVKIAQNAINNSCWNELNYNTDEKVLVELLNLWSDVFSNVRIDNIVVKDDFAWYNKPKPFQVEMKCHIHGIFLNQLGNTKKDCCYLCHNS